MTKTMVILKEAPFLFAAFAAIQYHHKLPSSGSRILATLPLAVEPRSTSRISSTLYILLRFYLGE